jgi:hypothetical protein
VKAVRGNTTRTLAIGSTVAGDDVIDTAQDGSIVIELFHNNARWTLEAGLKTRVDESVAWKLPKQDVADKVEHASSAAGRHGDRQAADTSVSAKQGPHMNFAEEDGEDGAEKPKAAAAAADPTPVKPPTKPGIVSGDGGSTKPRTNPKDSRPDAPKPPASGGSCDEVTCVLSNYEGACCSKFKKGGSRPTGANAPSSSSDLPEALGIRQISPVMTAAKAKIIACYTDPNLKGTLKIAIKVAPDGSVTSATVKQSFDPKVDACAVAVINALKFPATRTGGTFSYPIIIN